MLGEYTLEWSVPEGPFPQIETRPLVDEYGTIATLCSTALINNLTVVIIACPLIEGQNTYKLLQIAGVQELFVGEIFDRPSRNHPAGELAAKLEAA